MLFSVKFHTICKGSFFDWHSPVFCPQWRYVLLFEVYCSDIAHILKNSWSYVLLCDEFDLVWQRVYAAFNNKNSTRSYQGDLDHICIEIFGYEKSINLFER